MTTADSNCSEALPASARLYTANLRLLQRVLQLGVEAQQAFAQDALHLWSDFLTRPTGTRPADAWAPFGVVPSEPTWDAAVRGLRLAGGVSGAAATATGRANSVLQEAIADWQKAWARGPTGRPPGIDPAPESRRPGTTAA